MILLFFFSSFVIIYGQLSVDELFSFKSKYTSIGNCSDFQYTFPNLKINSNDYNQITFDCNSSNVIFRNKDQISSSSPYCPDENNYSNNFLIHFQNLSQTLIQVNQLPYHGIELCSLDNYIQNHYSEYSYYRSQWALLINFMNNNNNNNNKQDQHYFAIATNGKMTFVIFILSSEYNITNKDNNQIELIFPNENIFKFNQTSTDIWRIDQGYVRTPESLQSSITYQLSKSKFIFLKNETFFIYGIPASYIRWITVLIDDTTVQCNYDNILQCTFPKLPFNIHDNHEPILKIMYYQKLIFYVGLTLIPRLRPNAAPISHSIIDMRTLQVNIDENLCTNDSLPSLFTVIIHLGTEDDNSTKRYQDINKSGIGPIDCNTRAEIGQHIANMTQSIPTFDIISMNVDLIRYWYDHSGCQAERTKIIFT